MGSTHTIQKTIPVKEWLQSFLFPAGPETNLTIPIDLALHYVSQEPTKEAQSRTSVDEVLDESVVTEKEIEGKRLGELEQLLLAVLKDYWLQVCHGVPEGVF